MRNKYENPDYSGGDDSEFDDVEDLDDELTENNEEEEVKVIKKNKKEKKTKDDNTDKKQKETIDNKTKNESVKSLKKEETLSTIQNTQCEIYVDNLPFNRNEIDIKNFFAKLNKNVVFVKLLKDQNGKSKGRAFVKFISYSDALSIINEGEISMDKRKLRVSLVDKDKKKDGNKHDNESSNRNHDNKNTAQKKNLKNKNFELSLNSDVNLDINSTVKVDYKNNQGNTIFLKNLPDNIEEAKLKKVFKKFGKIANVRLLKKPDGSIKNFGYIDFESETSVEEAIKVGKLKLDNNDLIIEKAKSSFNQNVFNDSKTIARKRKREQAEKQRKSNERLKAENNQE